MIYCIISDSMGRALPCPASEDKVINSIPITEDLLPIEIREYIERGKNDNVKEERLSAYTSLSIGLRTFFDVKKFSLTRSPEGKPYVTIRDEKADNDVKDSEEKKCRGEIFISVSHSDGLCAVLLSDRKVGVDLQHEIDKERSEKIEKRFLSDFDARIDEIDFDIFYIKNEIDSLKLIKPNFFPIKKIGQSDLENETEKTVVKWALLESVMKLTGGGFSDFVMVKKEDTKTLSCVKKIFFEKDFYLAVATVK